MPRFLSLVASLLPLAAADLPVRQVVLYKNGVGYFERAGDVKAGEPAQLSFRQSEMNDILKSLTVRDASGSTVSGVRYESAEPLEQKLATFPFARGDDRNSLSSFLHRLQGSRLSAGVGSERIEGVIVLARRIPASDKQGEHEEVVLLLDSGEMRTLALDSVTSLQLADPALQAKLRDYLRLLAVALSADKRLVTIDSAGKFARSLTASYMVPAPIWKSSYRLVFEKPGETVLEGWAIVDNTSGEDWRDVRLSLVSGRPVSFISNLFETKTIERQVADVPELASVNPVVYEGGVVGGAPGGVMGGIIGAVPSAAPPPPPPQAKFSPGAGMGAGMGGGTYRVGQPARSTFDVRNTGAREFADLFEYSFTQPVRILAGESAMLPFVQQKIGARKLLVYSDPSSRHPMSAVELTNSTGKTLDGGPITVFEAASYAGEALMNTLKSGDKRLVSYAVDLGTRLTTALESGSQDIRELHVRRGVLLARWALRNVQTYTIRNVDAHAKTLLIEHPIRHEFKLIGVKPVETTATAYRFEVKLAPNAEETFPVTEEQEQETIVTLTSATPDVLATYIANRALTPAGRRALEQISGLKQKIDALQQQLQAASSDVQNLERDQERTRQNIRSLNEVSGQQEQVQRYARGLSEQEAKLAALRDRQAELTKQKSTVEAQMKTLVDSTEF